MQYFFFVCPHRWGKNSYWPKALVLLFLINHPRIVHAQLPVWYSGNHSLAFDGGDYEIPVAATHTFPAMPSVWVPKPDATPWLWLTPPTSTSIGQYRDDTGTQLPILGAYPPTPNYDIPYNFRQSVAPSEGIFVLPNTRECDRFTLIYPTYSTQLHPTENFPDASYLTYATIQLQPSSNHVVAPGSCLAYSTIASADGYLASYAASADPATTTRYFAALINCPTPYGTGGLMPPNYLGANDSTYWTLDCLTYGNWPPPFETGFAFRSRAILYKTVDGSNGTNIVPVALTKGGGEIPNNLFDGKLVVSRSGKKIAWITKNTSKSGIDVVFVDFSRPYTLFAGNRVRLYSFGMGVSRTSGVPTFTDISFDPLNDNIVFVTGGRTSGVLARDGLTALDFTNSFATPTAQPTATTLSGYANAAKDNLFVGFDKTLYLMNYPSATTSLLRTITYNANGLVDRPGNPSLSLPYKLSIPAQVDGEYYNNLRAVTGPSTARVVAPATTVNVTFRGPDVWTIPGIQTVAYTWKLNGIVVSSSKVYSPSYSIGSYPLSLMTSVTRCGKVRSWITYRTLNVTN